MNTSTQTTVTNLHTLTLNQLRDLAMGDCSEYSSDDLAIAWELFDRLVEGGRITEVDTKPVAYMFADEWGRTKIVLGKETAEYWCPPDENITPLYTSPQPLSDSNIPAEPPKVPSVFPISEQFTVEPHGDGYVIYQGRDKTHHGLNLAHLTECTPEFAKYIELALNAMSGQMKVSHLKDK